MLRPEKQHGAQDFEHSLTQWLLIQWLWYRSSILQPDHFTCAIHLRSFAKQVDYQRACLSATFSSNSIRSNVRVLSGWEISHSEATSFFQNKLRCPACCERIVTGCIFCWETEHERMYIRTGGSLGLWFARKWNLCMGMLKAIDTEWLLSFQIDEEGT